MRGESFAALARRYSTDPGSRLQGGRLTVGQGQTVEPFNRVAFTVKTGALSLPVRTAYGWHLIQPLTGIRPARTTPFDGVRDSIAQRLLQERRSAEMWTWVRDVRAAYVSQIVYAPGFGP